MDNSAIAILISVISAAIATFSLGWNVYRDVVLKPKVVVTFGIKNVFQQGRDPSPDYVGISAVNHGPGAITLNTIVLKETSPFKRFFKKEKFAVLNYDWNNPYSGRLPAKLDVGEGVDLFVDFKEGCFLSNPFTHLGINDSFGRSSWAKKSAMKLNRNKWKDKFEVSQH
jgi:hypothetical protein